MSIFTCQRKFRIIKLAASSCWSAIAFVAVLVGGLFVEPVNAQLLNPATALREYVRAPDSAFGFSQIATVPQGDLTLYVLTMTSQEWRSSAEVDRTLWQHWVVMIVPQTIRGRTAGLVIGGGANSSSPDLSSTEVAIAAQLARASGSVVAVLGQSPNQPITPLGGSIALSEDALIAYSWRRAMDTGDWGWVGNLPMVKSAVRAMDAVQMHLPVVSQGSGIDKFVVIGFSKRGVATYLTGAMDPRVTAIAPGVYDFLDMSKQFEHHFESLGFYSESMAAYTANGIQRRTRSPEGADLARVVDPYSYRQLLVMPKFLIHSSGDRFFMPDSARFYQADLPGETLLRHVPNTDHSLSSSAGISDVLTSLIAWYQRITLGVARPQVSSWVSNGRLQVRSSPPASAAKLWRATNAAGRDFRRQTTGEAWQSTPLADQGHDLYSSFSANLEAPTDGYAAAFIELTFSDGNGLPQTYSTRIHITPDEMPFEVVDQINNPRNRSFWQRQIDIALGASGTAEIDAVTLRSYLPIPLFGEHISTLEQARQVLRGAKAASSEARRQCLATRLNIARGELGWYSPMRLGGHRRSLWWHYQQAEKAMKHGLPILAWTVCVGINESVAQRTAPHPPVKDWRTSDIGTDPESVVQDR